MYGNGFVDILCAQPGLGGGEGLLQANDFQTRKGLSKRQQSRGDCIYTITIFIRALITALPVDIVRGLGPAPVPHDELE